MPLGKSPALAPGRLAAHARDSRLRGNGVLGKGARSSDRPNAVRPHGPREEFFLGTFKAGMLLKTRESRTKYMNSERLFRRKCAGLAMFEANPEVYLEDRTRIRCQVPGVRLVCWGGLNRLRKSFSQQTTTPVLAAPPEYRRGAFWGVGLGTLTTRKLPVLAIMYMKTQGLIGNQHDSP